MKISILLSSLLAVLVSAAPNSHVAARITSQGSKRKGPPLNYCEGDSKLFGLEKVAVTPYPPESGRKLKISASGVLKRKITKGATLLVKGKWGLIPVLNKNMDFCKITAKMGKPCPIMPGDFSVEFETGVPEKTPRVSIFSTFTILDANETVISCLSGKIRI